MKSESRCPSVIPPMVAHQSVSITTPKGSGRFCDHLFGREQRTVWQYGNTGSSAVVGYPKGVNVPLTCLQYEYLEYKPLCRYQRIGCRHTSERIHQHNWYTACQPFLHNTTLLTCVKSPLLFSRVAKHRKEKPPTTRIAGGLVAVT